MSSTIVRVTYRFVGSEARIAALLAWLEDGLPDPAKDPVLALAEQLGVVPRERAAEVVELNLDDVPAGA